MPLTLSQVKANPDLLTSHISFGDSQKGIFRPLVAQDAFLLAQFLDGLSFETRRFYVLDSYDISTAMEYCDAIARYDKLRFVFQFNDEIIALMEISFFITDGDKQRYQQYGIELEQGADCRFGPCIADQYQNSGLGTVLFPYIKTIASDFGQRRMILWGGVFANNHRAIHYYQKLGFRMAGNFLNQDNLPSFDMIMEI